MDTLADLERKWLLMQLELDSSTSTNNDLWAQYLNGETLVSKWGQPGDTINDAKRRHFEATDSETLNDAAYRWFNSLEAIAGKPAGMLTAPGTLPLSGFTQYGGLSLYAVADTASTLSLKFFCVFEDSTASAPASLYFATASGGAFARVGGANPAGANQSKTLPDTTILARRAVALVIQSEWHEARAYTHTGKSMGFTDGFRADGLLTQPVKLILPAPSSEEPVRPLIAIAYPAIHTEYQRTAIMRKLLQMSGG